MIAFVCVLLRLGLVLFYVGLGCLAWQQLLVAGVYVIAFWVSFWIWVC